MPINNQHKTTQDQRLTNRKPNLDQPLLLGTWEKKVNKIQKVLKTVQAAECSSFFHQKGYIFLDGRKWESEDIRILKDFWNRELQKYLDKIQEAHSGLVEELTDAEQQPLQ